MVWARRARGEGCSGSAGRTEDGARFRCPQHKCQAMLWAGQLPTLSKPPCLASHVGAKASLCTADRKNILKMGCHLQSKIVDIPILIIFSIIYFKRDTSKSVLSFSKLVVNFKADPWIPQLPGLLGAFRHVCEHKGVPRPRYLRPHHTELTN